MLHNVTFTHHTIHRAFKDDEEETDTAADDDHYSLELQRVGDGAPLEPFQLPRVTAVIQAGSVVAITGDGGTGKTTLMRIMARHYQPTHGWVSYPEYWRVRLLDAMDPPYFFKVCSPI